MKAITPYMLAALMLLSVSCGKTDLPQNEDYGNNICLRTDIDTPTKAEITDANGLTLYVTETSKNLFSGRRFSPDAATNGIWNTGEPWQSGEYSFFGYAYSEGNGRISSSISNNGRAFHVSQPADSPSADGSNSDFADYLLSYTYNVADGSTRPLVTLQMVHAVSSVELHFVKPAGAAETVVTSASVNNVKFSGTYSVYEHNANSIVWNCTPDDDQTNYSRTVDMTVPETGTGNDGNVSYYPDGSLYFSFLTVQQPVDNVTSPVTIKVDFKIDGIPYSSSFSLDSVQGVSNWMAGTKTRYAIILDSEVRLLGSIVSWKDGGDMEGTLVP